MKSYYEQWLDNEHHTKGLGSFHTALLELYKLASGDNRALLAKAFPEWFYPKNKQPQPMPSILLSDENRENLLISALEGGSNYWYFLADTSMVKEGGNHLTDLIWDAVKEGKSIPVWYIEDEPYTKKKIVGHLNMENIIKGETIMFTNHQSHYGDVISDNDDATTADVWLQLCTMGEIVYG